MMKCFIERQHLTTRTTYNNLFLFKHPKAKAYNKINKSSGKLCVVASPSPATDHIVSAIVFLIVPLVNNRIKFYELSVVALAVVNDLLHLLANYVRLVRTRTTVVVVKVG